MFTKYKNIDAAFSHIKKFSLVFLLVCASLSGFTIYTSYRLVERSQQKVFILANGKVLEAFSSEKKENLPVEIRDHVKMFHHWFFTLDPDEKVIQGNLSQALNLADQTAKRAYDNLREKGYYSNLIAANISQEITVDSVSVDIDQYPYDFRCFATQKLVRSSSTIYRKLITQGKIRNVSRSDNNPHGLLVINWETLTNTDEPPSP
jgi:conjugative transposon TraK protein